MSTSGEDLPDRIYQTYKDKTIFLTGGTGFIGKVFLERFLRLFDVKKIYVLVRDKKGKDGATRLKDIFEGPLFDTVRKMKGDQIFDKCKAIVGDITFKALNLSSEDQTSLKEEVEFVFHSAATVKFDEPLNSAVLINVKGTREVMQLAREMKKLQAVVHISTAYCHPEETFLEEKPYKPPGDPENFINLMEWLSDKQVQKMTPTLLEDMPNSYAFSKALAEQVVVNEMDNLPVMIVRPSIVVPIWKEPIPGWTDNINGPTGLMIAAGKGVLRSMYGNPDALGDFISADGVADYTFCNVADFLINGKQRRIYNICTSKEVKVTWGEVTTLGRDIAVKDVPFNTMLWCPGGGIRKYRVQHLFCVIFCHLLPALLVDVLVRCFGYEPFLWKIQMKIQNGMQILEYYTSNEWTFDYSNTLKVRSWLNSVEKSKYVVHIEGFDKRKFFISCAHAARRYILKEPDEDFPKAKRLMFIMVWLDRVCNVLLKLLLGYLVYKYFICAVFLQ